MAKPADIAKRLDKILDYLPDMYKNGKNMKAMFGAISESDADLNNLFLEVKNQLFVNTAEGQYLDMLGSNVGVNRPPLIGMVDTDFREFIKLETYYPKQIKQLLFRLMELFYGSDTIKANIRSTAYGPYTVFDGSTLDVMIDNQSVVNIVFTASRFNDSSSVTPEEMAAQINAQAQGHLFATTYYNAIDKQDFLEIYTNTYGPVGSVEIIGGSANRFLKFPNTLRLGATIGTNYRIVKELSDVKLYWAGGQNPLFAQVQSRDSVLLTGSPFSLSNSGSYKIEKVSDTGIPAYILSCTSATLVSANTVRYSMSSTTNIQVGKQVTITGFTNSDNNGTLEVTAVTSTSIDVLSPRVDSSHDETVSATVDLLPSASYISYTNDNAETTDIFAAATSDDILFFRPTKVKLESAKRPATVWEIKSNEIVVTLPATPVVVRRNLAGSCHVQGTSAVIKKATLTAIDLQSPDFFPLLSGSFYLQKPNGQLDRTRKYTYAVKSNNQLLSVTPQIVPMGTKLQLGIGPLSTTNGSNSLIITSVEPHELSSGELVRLSNFDGFAGLQDSDINGTFAVDQVIDQFTVTVGLAASATQTASNAPSVDKGEIFTVHNSQVVVTNVQQNTGYVGSYIYDPKNAPYTISGTQTTTQQELLLGEFGGSITVHDSTVFSESSGQVIIGYGRDDQEGPIRYIAKPNSNTIFVDPSYRFKKSHEVGVAVNLLGSSFATTPNSTGGQLPVYVVDTITPRTTLQNLLLDAKAAGVSVRFIVILPDNVYNAFGLYDLLS